MSTTDHSLSPPAEAPGATSRGSEGNDGNGGSRASRSPVVGPRPHRLRFAAAFLALALLLGTSALYAAYAGLGGVHAISLLVLAVGVAALLSAGISVVLLLVALGDEELGLSAQRLLNAAPSALLLLDRNRRISYANPASERLLNRPAEELRGRTLSEVLPTPKGELALEEVFEHPFSNRTVPLVGPRRAPGVQQVEVTIDRRGGRGHNTVVLLQDATERARLVDALAERAAELARSNRELEQFAYVASHDLQEPLRMVGSYTQLLESRYRGKMDADADEFLHYAHDGALRMKQLIDDLLLYARLDARPPSLTPVDLEEVLRDVLHTLRGVVESTQGEVTHDPLPTLKGDRPQLAQLLQNLIGNALKFHARDAPRVRLTVQRKDAFWEFCVEDNGIGIPPDSQERVFLMFQRLHGRDEYPGSGIGLTVCKKVVERHGGRIWVESLGVPGMGTKVHFTLPTEPPTSPKGMGIALGSAESEEASQRARTMIEDRLRELA